MTKSSQKSMFEEAKEMFNSVKSEVNKQVHHYSGAEAWRDVKKTAVVTTTAVFTVLCCFASSAE
jgi:hypothetical protein